MEIKTKKFRVEPGDTVKLENFSPSGTGDFEGGKSEGEEQLTGLNDQLEILQEDLYAAHKHAILIVLQGMDTCGKDGTIRKVFDGVNPQGVRVANFKAPTSLELDHDYLWRVHQQAPARGEMVIFNRSHYEDVLVVRVHQLVPPKTWQKRYQQINQFERLLADEGTTIVKFFLNISKDEQKERLLERLDAPEKNWKFNPGDLKERGLWNDYMAAYEDVLCQTSTEHAPWYIIPADRKWFRDLVISTVLIDTLKKLDSQPPAPFSAEEIQQFRAQLDQT
jgi:PPK2 family polyphosphate:nucleotide phosphotransferase